MKIFAIRDASLDRSRDLAWLLYYESDKTFYIHINKSSDEWDTPLILSSFVKRGSYSLDSYSSSLWVEQRIIPPDRQNLGMILKTNGLDEYDPFGLLMLSSGRCAQDDCFLVPLKSRSLPKDLEAILSNNISGLIKNEDRSFVITNDGKIRYIDCDSFKNILERSKQRLKCYYDRIVSLEKCPGGNALCCNGYEITSELVCRELSAIPFTENDIITYIQNNLKDTSAASDLLGCTKQNVIDLVKRGKLSPVVKTKNSFLFLQRDLQRT